MSDTDPTVRVRLDARPKGTVAFVTVDNALKLNTFNTRLMQRFVAEVASLAKRDDLRAVVLTGAGDKAFIGGADIRELASLAHPTDATRFIEHVHDCCRCLRDLPVPVIARVNGYALGAGLEVMAACDVRVAASSAVFGMPEVRVGVPSVVEAALLPGLIGWGRTRRLLLLAENIGADEALAWGLVDKVVPTAALDHAVDEWLHAIEAAGPNAIKIQKQLIREWETLPLDQAVRAGVTAFARAFESEEPRAMTNAFLNRPRR